MTAIYFPTREESKHIQVGKNRKKCNTENCVPYFFSYPKTAKLLVTAYPNGSKPELEGLHFIQVVTVWHTKQPQNIEAAASKSGRKLSVFV